MAREKLTIKKDKAKLKVIGNSYPDALTNSGDGDDLIMELIEILTGLEITLPDIDLADWDGIPTIIGLDGSNRPELVYEDPDTGELTEWILTGLNWSDFLDVYDPSWELGYCITGLDANDLPYYATVDSEYIVQIGSLPSSIVIVTQPYRRTYRRGRSIDLSGMTVTAKKADSTTWTGPGYPDGSVPVGELISEPYAAEGSGTQTVTVTWRRPCDGVELSATFTITVTTGGGS